MLTNKDTGEALSQALKTAARSCHVPTEGWEHLESSPPEYEEVLEPRFFTQGLIRKPRLPSDPIRETTPVTWCRRDLHTLETHTLSARVQVVIYGPTRCALTVSKVVYERFSEESEP